MSLPPPETDLTPVVDPGDRQPIARQPIFRMRVGETHGSTPIGAETEFSKPICWMPPKE
jgi:hypothetical protein